MQKISKKRPMWQTTHIQCLLGAQDLSMHDTSAVPAPFCSFSTRSREYHQILASSCIHCSM